MLILNFIDFFLCLTNKNYLCNEFKQDLLSKNFDILKIT